MYLQFINDLTMSGILPKFAALIKAECERTGKTAIEVIDEGLKSGPRAIKMKFLAAMQANAFSSQEANETVNEFFRRLAQNSGADELQKRKDAIVPLNIGEIIQTLEGNCELSMKRHPSNDPMDKANWDDNA